MRRASGILWHESLALESRFRRKIALDNANSCGYKSGPLPSCAPLALAVTPAQQNVTPKYDTNEALKRGTLFPGLDLPFKNIVNTKNVADTAMGELMALHFVCHELQLYLDTHESDTEAFALLKSMLALTQEAHRRYAEKYGPVSVSDLAGADCYSWIQGPWPWEYQGEEG